MFNFHKKESLFQTRVVIHKKEELPPELKAPEPIAQTKKEQKEINKHKYLPAERLQMKLNKQAKKEKKKKAKPILKKDDINRISDSVGRIMAAMD